VRDNGSVTDPRARRFREVLALEPDGSREAFRVTTCYAASSCQWDLGCPYLGGCHSAAADLLAGSDRDLAWQYPTLEQDDDN